jgi:protein-tyrosine phosphatase
MSQFYPAKQVSRGLWVGSEGNARNARFLRDKNIGLIVNASRHIPMYFPHGPARTYRIPVDDDPRCNRTMLRHWPVVVAAIDDTLRSGKAVLVHCRAGMQRSAATAAAYLMWKRGLTADAAMALVRRRK